MTADLLEKANKIQDNMDHVAAIIKGIEASKSTMQSSADCCVVFTFGNWSNKSAVCYPDDTQLLKKILDIAETYYLDKATALFSQFEKM